MELNNTYIELALEDVIMIYLTKHEAQHQEYSARFGLKQALNDMEIAQQLAEQKYRSLVGREIFSREIADIHQLIEELRAWVVITKEKACESVCQH